MFQRRGWPVAGGGAVNGRARPAAPVTPLPAYTQFKRPKWMTAACVVGVLGLAASAWAWRAPADHDWAVASVSRVRQLAETGRREVYVQLLIPPGRHESE